MGADADHQYVIALLEAMTSRDFLPDSMSWADKVRFADRFERLKEQYELEVEKNQGRAADDQDRKEFEKLQENLAKALPNLTKGTLAAISAFSKDDPITGSAAVMDICASIAPVVAGLSMAGGPPGMVIAAIFSAIGQILSFFAPKSQSLSSQLEAVLRKMKAEEKLEKVEADHTDIKLHARSLQDALRQLEKALDKPDLKAEELTVRVGVVKNELKSFNPAEGGTLRDFRETLSWLKGDANQRLDQWPTVLAASCLAYTELLVSMASLFSLANADNVRKRFDAPDQSLQGAVNSLRAAAIQRLNAYRNSNILVAESLGALTPAMRNRGMVWQIDETSQGRLWAGTNIRQGRYELLGGEHKRIGVGIAKKDVGAPFPTFHVLALEPWVDKGWAGYDRTYHGVVKPYYTNAAWSELKGKDSSLRGLTDIWVATPTTARGDDVYFYTAKARDINGYVLGDGFQNASYRKQLKTNAISVRVVHEPAWFANDPDIGAEGAAFSKIDYMVYGGCESSPEIYVDAGGPEKLEGYVPSPFASYRALGVDQHYLWLFTSDWLACTTHASVSRCLRKKTTKPSWIKHWAKDVVFDPSYFAHERKVDNMPPLKGLLSLGACDDGTVLVAGYKRSIVVHEPERGPVRSINDRPWYEVVDSNVIYSGVYDTHLTGDRTQEIGFVWTKIDNAEGVQVQKTPVYCWSIVEKLKSAIVQLNLAWKDE